MLRQLWLVNYRHPANIVACHGSPLSTCPSSQAEVGHNFGAIHAFDYCGKDGWGDNTPVDYCKQSDNGCSQPNGYGIVPKCTSAPTAFGGGGGTIMSESGTAAFLTEASSTCPMQQIELCLFTIPLPSAGYCDEIAPNYIRNVAMTFGKNHPCEYCSDAVQQSCVTGTQCAFDACRSAGGRHLEQNSR